MYKDIQAFVASCLTCQARAAHNVRVTVQETNSPSYQDMAWHIDTPFRESLAGNKYLVNLVDPNSGWVESFPVRNKTAENVAHVLLEEIIPRFSFPVYFSSDLGTECK